MTDMMKAAVLHSPNDIRIEEVPIPEIDDDEVLVRVKAVGICGSDVNYYKTGGTGAFRVKEPMILGHECAGEVVKVGSAVKRLKVGDRVAVEPGVPCLKCRHCLSGRYNLCPDVVFMATPPHDGAFAEYVKTVEEFAFLLPDNVSYEEGGMIEPLAVGLYACKRGQVEPGDRVVVIGCGPVGLLTIQAARVAGATQVVGVDLQPNRLEFAKKLGATAVVSPTEGSQEQITRALNGEKADVVIDAAGVLSSLKLGIDVVRRGGRFVLIGVPGGEDVPIPLIYLLENEIDILPVFRYVNMYPRAIRLVASGAIDVKSMITHRFPLDEAKEAMDFAHDNKFEAIKIIVEC